jgi:hypothetical protein
MGAAASETTRPQEAQERKTIYSKMVRVQNEGNGLVQNTGNSLNKVFKGDKLLDALEKEWTYGTTDGVCLESVAGR